MSTVEIIAVLMSFVTLSALTNLANSDKWPLIRLSQECKAVILISLHAGMIALMVAIIVIIVV